MQRFDLMDRRRIKAAKASIDQRQAERPFGINRLLLNRGYVAPLDAVNNLAETGYDLLTVILRRNSRNGEGQPAVPG